jgi:hypothetical protein
LGNYKQIHTPANDSINVVQLLGKVPLVGDDDERKAIVPKLEAGQAVAVNLRNGTRVNIRLNAPKKTLDVLNKDMVFVKSISLEVKRTMELVASQKNHNTVGQGIGDKNEQSQGEGQAQNQEAGDRKAQIQINAQEGKPDEKLDKAKEILKKGQDTTGGTQKQKRA